MLKKTITYNDYNGNELTEDFYFNLSPVEMFEMETSVEGGLTEMMKQVIDARDNSTIIKVFKNLILKAYGEKSPDGKRFIKSEELSNAFAQTEAFSNLFMELATDSQAAAAFVKGVLPASMVENAASSGLSLA